MKVISRSEAAALEARIEALEAEAYELRARLGGDRYVDGQVWQLGICGCGEPEAVIASLALYLRKQQALHAERTAPVADWAAFSAQLDADYHQDAVAELWAAYTADRLSLTEHGSGVGGAWLTDKGRAWLANWEAAQESDSVTT